MDALTTPADEPEYGPRSLVCVALFLKFTAGLVGLASIVLILTIYGALIGAIGLAYAWTEIWATRRILELRRSGRNTALAISAALIAISLWYIRSSDDSVGLFFLLLSQVPVIYPLVKHWKLFE